MTRDLELVRSILLIAENGGDQHKFGYAFGVRKVAQHLEWMMQANLIKGRVNCTSVGVPETFEIFQPTWQGLEFLASARDEDTWQKVMETCADAPFGVVSAVLREIALRKARSRI